MQKKKTLSILGVLCLLMSFVLPVFKTHVHAEEGNQVTLNFIGATVQEGKAIYEDDSKTYSSEVSLVTKNFDGGETYSDCFITGNFMNIDLNEKNYYLKVVSKDSVNNPDEILGAGSGSPFNKMYINDTQFDITSNPYVGLQTDSFSGNLNIKLEKEPTPPTLKYPDDIQIEATYDGFGMEISLNSERVGSESKNISGIAKGYASGEIGNLIRIQLAFGDGNIGSVTVNDENIALPEGTKDHVEFTLKPASKYVIEVKKAQDTSGTPRTIIWDSDKTNNSSLKDHELLKNGTIEILDIKDLHGNSIGLENVDQDIEKNNGWASVLPHSRVILRLKPNYGYQLTSIKINDETLAAGEQESTFEYIMPDTNVHFSSIFEKVDDKVVTESNKVKDGKIELDGSEINSGSVVLSVNDVNLTEEQISNFKNKADGYQLSSFLNIRLEHVLYKGTDSDVWSKQLKDLNNPATITLKLEEGVKGNEVVIVHEKHDGTYEVIPATYDSSTNTITFKTSSFSNYAVASKTATTDASPKDTSTNNIIKKNNSVIPQTGDNIAKYFAIFVLCVLVLVVFLIITKRKKQNIKK